MADTIDITAGTGTKVSTEEITTLNGGGVSAQHMQRMLPSLRTADGVGVDVTDAAPMPIKAVNAEAAIAAGTAPSKVMVIGGVYNNTLPAPTDGQTVGLQLDRSGNQRVALGQSTFTGTVWNSGTALNATQPLLTTAGAPVVVVHLVQSSGTFSAGAITFEGTYDGTNWITVPAIYILDPATLARIAVPYTLVASTNKAFAITVGLFQQLRMKLSTAITGTGTVTPQISHFNYDPVPLMNANGAALVDGSAVNQPVNLQIAGTAVDGNSGNKSAGTLRTVLATDQPSLATPLNIQGGVASDGVDSGNPVKTGGRAQATLAGATLVSSADRVDTIGDLDGGQVVRPFVPLGDIITQRVTDTGGTSTNFSSFPATANTRNYLSQIVVYNDSTTNGFLDIRDGSAGSVILTVPLPAKGGASISFALPLRQPTVNTALAYDVNAGLTTVYITAIGFQSKL